MVPHPSFMPYPPEVSDQRTVRVATCHDPAEATLIRSILTAHGIEAMIPGEGAASVGVAAVGFITHVFVGADHAEDAAALIAQMRAGVSELVEDEEEDGEVERDGSGAVMPSATDVAVVVDQRLWRGIAVLFALVPTFGAGHMATGAWKRGLMLGAVELVGLRHVVAGNAWGTALIVAAVLVDFIGALVRVRRRIAPAPLPVARVAPPVRGSRSRARS
jgi:hypothetical protein